MRTEEILKEHRLYDERHLDIVDGIKRAMEVYANEKLSATWNFFPDDGLPKEDKPVLIFRPMHEPNVIGAFYEGDVEHGEFHNGEEGINRVVYTNIKAWTNVLEAPELSK